MTGRRFAELGSLDLELGGTLPDVQVAYETWGAPQRDPAGRVSNAVLILHALTGDAHVAGPAGPDQPSAGWWDSLIGSGRPLDPADWFVVSANVLGGCRGTTGPATLAADGRAWGSRFPRITIRDQVLAEVRLADHLGIDRFQAVLGGSMGGMRALEWVIGYPDRVGAALVLAVGAAATADQIGLQTTQINAIRLDPNWNSGDYRRSADDADADADAASDAGATSVGPGTEPVAGLGLARQIAHLSYRGEVELDTRFGHAAQPGEDPLGDGVGRYAVQSYLDHQADKLVRRFDAGSYVVLTEAMNTHDVGRGRGGVAAALGGIEVPLVVAGLDTDRLYPLRLQAEIAALTPTCTSLDVIESPFGHDGFLIEAARVEDLTRRVLALSVERFAQA